MSIQRGRMSALILGLVAGPALLAQAELTGTASGTVKGPGGQPLGGARVTVSSPALFTPRSVMVDERGEWRIPLLPPGNYRIVLQREGYAPKAVENVRIGAGASVRQDLSLAPIKEASASVEVIGNASGVDKAEAKTAVNFSESQLAELAISSKDWYSTLDLSPGASFNPGGGITIRGSASQHTLFQVNGTSVKDDLQGVATDVHMIEDNIEDVQVVLSALHPRNGRSMGGLINVVTKSGGNDFAGSIRSKFSRDSWYAVNTYWKHEANSVTDSLNRAFDLTLSGPILKDRLWFSLGAQLRPTQRETQFTPYVDPRYLRIHRTGNASIDALTASDASGNPLPGSAIPAGYKVYTFDSQVPFTRTSEQNFYEGKLTFAITSDHTVEASFSSFDGRIDNRSNPARLAQNSSQDWTEQSEQINYRGVFGSDTFLTAHVNNARKPLHWPRGDTRSFGGGEVVDTWADAFTGSRQYQEIQYGLFASGWGGQDERNSRGMGAELKLLRTLFGQSHEIDLGFDWYRAENSVVPQYGTSNNVFRSTLPVTDGQGQWLFPAIIWRGPGQFGQSGSGNTGLAPVNFRYFGPTHGFLQDLNQGVYVADSWTLNTHWNMFLGLRIDQFKSVNTDGSQIAKQTDYSPRLQVRYDANGDAKHLFTFTAAKLPSEFLLGFTGIFRKSPGSVSATLGFSGIPGQPLPGDPSDGGMYGLRFLNYQQFTDPANYRNAYAFSDSSKNVQVRGDLKTPYAEELTGGYRRGFDTGGFTQINFVYRSYKNQWGQEREYGQPGDFVRIDDPTGSGLPSRLSQVTWVFSTNELKREYKAVELSWQSSTLGVWRFGGNYTYSRLTGNDEGGDSTSSTFRDNAVAGYYNHRRFLTQNLGLTDSAYSPQGALSADHTHKARVFIIASLPLGKGEVSYGWTVSYDSGSVYSMATNAPLPIPKYVDPNGLASPTPAYVYTKYYGGRNIYANNDVYSVDFKLNFYVPLGFAKVQLIGDLFVGNLFNHMIRWGSDRSTVPYATGSDFLWLQTDRFGKTPDGTNWWTNGRSAQASLGLRF